MPTLLMESPAHQAFRSSPYPSLRELYVEETDTSVILRGTVTSYYHKQQALETIKPLLAGRELLNHVIVREGQ